MTNSVHIIGGGLAGCEAAWQVVKRGIPVILHEMRPTQPTAAHKTDRLAELVCSNSLRSDDSEYNAVGLLHDELRRCDSLILKAADDNAVPAGGALAVDRDGFSDQISRTLEEHPLITIERSEVASLPPADWDNVIIATGPLTSPALSAAIKELTGEEALSFFDALAPIIHKDSIDMSKAWYQSRYDKGEGTDYINCALSQEQYDEFINDLLEAEKMEFHEWEKDTPYFEGCLPIEVMAERGPKTLSFGPLKPVGLTNPNNPDQRNAAVVQLRQDNKLGTLWNMVGFQTKMKHGEQVRVLRKIPGLENAEFARLGGIHRNTFLNSPKILDTELRLKADPRIRFAGQITGCEGYVESTAVGWIAGQFAAAQRLGEEAIPPPETTALGAILNHITKGGIAETFQPMNVNFGLLPPVDLRNAKGRKVKGRERKLAQSQRAKEALTEWLKKFEKDSKLT
ncbi:MAG: methylenetetrahydrofolate--tRNA-(uracil(54)-C(5))-methyltransferase (FADH(2)-oxidizing) TrmFO [Rhodospirillales bacterium]|nr:methylenetetrahydrofolate--tRNA-(uracil(54)-C(5))-methyltransferase (FADH(2)-oxidizing) TrmFO [Rhodospirillales bacterium]